MDVKEFLSSIFPKIGDGVSWATEKIIKFVSQLGIGINAFQSKIISIIMIGVLIWFVLSVLNITKTMVKWGIAILLIVLALSVFVSMF